MSSSNRQDPDPEKGLPQPGSSAPIFDAEHHEPRLSLHSISDTSETEHNAASDTHADSEKRGRQPEHHDHGAHSSDDEASHHPEDTIGHIRPRSRSRASSAGPKPAVVVPKDKRRGLFSSLTIIPEVECPYNYKRSTKWLVTMTVAAATAAAPIGSGIFYPALVLITKDLNTTQTITNLAVAMYMLAMAIFPLWWSAFSEEYGRRSVYIVSFALFTIFSVLCAVSRNITMLIIFRICSGGAAASVQAVGAGTIADLWEPVERGRAMSIFYLGPLIGPIIAPIVGGVLTNAFGWQAPMWFLAIFGLVIFCVLLIALPETLARPDQAAAEAEPEPVALTRTRTVDSVKKHSKKVAGGVKRFLFDPLSVLLFLRLPPVLITVILAAIAFGALFVVNISIQQKFGEAPYHFPTLIVGVMYLPSGIGYFLSSLLGGRWLDAIMAREARKANRYDEKGKLVYLPEDRMRENMWLAITAYPLSLLLFGWSLQHGLHWIAPAIGAFIFGLSSMLVFSTGTTMLTEFIRKKSSAGVAVNNFVRNILSCIGTVVAGPWVTAWGPGWVFTAVCLFCLIVSYICVILLLRNAQRWRKELNEKLNNM